MSFLEKLQDLSNKGKVNAAYGSGAININQVGKGVLVEVLGGSRSPIIPQKLDAPMAQKLDQVKSAHPTSAQFFGSGMQINPNTMCDTIEGKLTGSCSNHGHTDLMSKLSNGMHGSSARRGNEDMKETGIVPFTVQPSHDVVLAGTNDDQYKSQVDLSSVECVDCSAVDKDTFLDKCVLDKNVGYALMRFAQCNIKANRHINQNSGSRQIEKSGERDGAKHNLTNSKNTDSSDGTNSAPGAGAMYGHGGLYGFGSRAYGSGGDPGTLPNAEDHRKGATPIGASFW